MKQDFLRGKLAQGIILALLVVLHTQVPLDAFAQDSDGTEGWMIIGTGTSFEITNSEYLNITLTSSESVEVILVSVPGTISLEIAGEAASTQLTISGFELNKEYYRYQDGELQDTFTADANGQYAYTQDLSDPHSVYIQEEHSTINIRSDGLIVPATAPIVRDGETYTVTADIQDGVFIRRSGITFDGAGHTLRSWRYGASRGIGMWGVANVTIKNVRLEEFYTGLHISNSHHVTVENVTADNNWINGMIIGYAHSNTITDCLITNTYLFGVFIADSTSNVIKNNTIQDNGSSAFYSVRNTSLNRVYHNNIIDNAYREYWAQARSHIPNQIIWDNGYPDGGNYWSDYVGADDGSNDRVADDGIGDTNIPHPWDSPSPGHYRYSRLDHYPLMAPYCPNEPPVADAGGPYDTVEGTEIVLDGSGSSDPDGCGGDLEYRWDFDDDGIWDTAYATDPTASHTWTDDYTGTVRVEVFDGEYTDQAVATVTVNNGAPAVTATGDIVDENGFATVSGSIIDPGVEDAFVLVIDWGEGSASYYYPAGATAYSEMHLYLDDNPTGTTSDIYNIDVSITDDDGGVGASSTTVQVNNVAPTITELTGPVDPVQVDAPVEMNASFVDPGTLDTHTAIFEWGDVSSDGGIVTGNEGGGTVYGNHTYTEPGVYTVGLTVADDDGGSDWAQFQYVVIYDPYGAFVTGGGWIDSPVGAYTPDPALTGHANFGFFSKYKPGQLAPMGNTAFRFHAAHMRFSSDSYDWLVVAGPRAMFKGVGTINGEGNYGFMVSAIDGQINGGGGVDKFRIKIWDRDDGDAIVYDNNMGDPEDGEPTTAIGGGQIKIHR
jgi:parallel beta-helix repeat protein